MLQLSALETDFGIGNPKFSKIMRIISKMRSKVTFFPACSSVFSRFFVELALVKKVWILFGSSEFVNAVFMKKNINQIVLMRIIEGCFCERGISLTISHQHDFGLRATHTFEP